MLESLAINRQSNGGPSIRVLRGVLLVLGVALFGSVAETVQAFSAERTSLPAHTLLWALIFCSVINYLISRDVLYPGCMFSAIWVFTTAVYLRFPGDIDSIQWTTVLILLGGTVSFSIGCVLGARPLYAGPAWFSNPTGNPRIRKLLLIYCGLMVPYSIYSTMKLAGIYNFSAAMFVAARQAVVDIQTEGTPASTNPLLSMAPTIAVSTAFVLIMEEKQRWIRLVGIGTAIILGLFTTGRIILLLLFCGWLFLIVLRETSRSLLSVSRKIASAAIFILLVMTLVPLLTKTETQAMASGDQSPIAIAGRMTATYVAGPMAAFNYIVENPATFHDQSNNTFAQILTPLRTLGLPYDPPPHFDPFFPVPFLINAFTAYKAFYVDFGSVGCCLALLICGVISGYLFAAAIRGNKFATFAFCYFGYAIVFSPFQNSFILLYRYAYVALFGVIYFVLVPSLPRVKFLGSRKRGQTQLVAHYLLTERR